jgi:PadR family transcriptional regulator, regulatory protein PadR
MRMGHEHGHRHEHGEAFPRISRVAEPCLLLLLRDGASHGYNLLDRLQQFGLAGGMMDHSIVYRMLRDMEHEEWVVSKWDMSGGGPPRRVYSITLDGEERLRWWVADLRRMSQELGQFLATYEEQEEKKRSKV